MTSSALLQVRNLNIAHTAPDGRPLPVVRNLSLHVSRGETLAVVGESGCGKSTTALALMRLLPSSTQVSADTCTLQGQDLLTAPEATMRQWRGSKVAMVFQDALSALNPVRTIGQQIGEVLRTHHALSAAQIQQRTIELLERVKIPEAARRAREYPLHLSGGMRQRVMIAMALAGDPQLLIADEPTTALDVTVQAQILRLLYDLQQETGMGLILISHDLGVVAEIADRVTVMYAGEGIEERQVDALFRQPAHPYTRSLLRARPTPGVQQSQLQEIPGSVQVGQAATGCLFAERCAERTPACSHTLPPPLALDDGWFRCLHAPALAESWG